MRRCLVSIAVLGFAGCSGDDSHRHVTTPKVSPAPIVKADGGIEVVVPPGTAALNESMAVSYWTTPDEITGGERYAAKDYAAALTAFTPKRRSTC